MDIRNVLLETVWDDIIAALTVSCAQVTHSGHSKKEAPKQTPGPKRGLAMRGWLWLRTTDHPGRGNLDPKLVGAVAPKQQRRENCKWLATRCPGLSDVSLSDVRTAGGLEFADGRLRY